MEKQPMEIVQENKKGANGTQIVQQNNYYGMTYSETKALCMDLIKSELDIYKGEAEITAKQRDEQLLLSVLSELEREKLDDKTVCEEFKNPDMQYVYVEAQKAYIRIGTTDLEKMLTDLLVNRVKERNRSLLQIVLGEAVTVVPTILVEQFDILALCFMLRYTRSLVINNMESFLMYLQNSILKFVGEIKPKESLFQHLVYAKTGSIDIGEISLESIFLQNYGGLFLKGYNLDELQDYEKKYPTLFNRCIQDNTKYQINAISFSQLEIIISKINDMPNEDIDFLKSHFNSNLMSESEVKKCICKKVSVADQLFQKWNETTMKHFTLTSVGIVLGAYRVKQVTNREFDLNIWI